MSICGIMHNHMCNFLDIPERREEDSGNWGPGSTLSIAFLSFLVTTVQLVHRQYTRRRESEPLSEQRPTIFGHGWGERGEMVGQLEPRDRAE